jgi:threonine aldolase
MAQHQHRSFASDNYAGVLPEVLQAVVAANSAVHESAYGDDSLTQTLDASIKAHFGPHAVGFPVFNGTGANVIALSAACPRHAPAVLCAASAHIQCDEGGAPEAAASLKLHLVATEDGKLTPALLRASLGDQSSVHRSQPACVSITNTTELGTVYSPAEVTALAEAAHEMGLLLHLDGARIANAAAALGVPMRAFTTDAGVDIISFGGTKAGAIAAEAVVVLNPALLTAVPFLRKTLMQLCSKQRFLSAQLVALLEDVDGTPLCVRAAAHANAMAARLRAGLDLISGVALPPVAGEGCKLQANACFPVLPAAVTRRLHAAGWRFYVWDATTGQVRFMCAWDTGESDVDAFLESVRAAMAAEAAA